MSNLKRRKGEIIDFIFELLENNYEINRDKYLSCNEIVEILNEKKSSVQSALTRMKEQGALSHKSGPNRSNLYQHKPAGANAPLPGIWNPVVNMETI